MNSDKRFADLTFEQAVHKYADTVTGVCVMRLQNAADAEDCFQNTFSKLWFKSPDFQSEEHLKAWLIRVAIHTSILTKAICRGRSSKPLPSTAMCSISTTASSIRSRKSRSFFIRKKIRSNPCSGAGVSY